MFTAIIRKSAQLLMPAVLVVAVAGSVSAAGPAKPDASDSRDAQVTGEIDRGAAVPGAGMADVARPEGVPSSLLRRDGRLRNGLEPNPLTFG
jgi:hypothetical protein